MYNGVTSPCRWTSTYRINCKTGSLTGCLDRGVIVISIVTLQINPHVWLDLNSPLRLFSRHRPALEPKSLSESIKVDKFDSSHRIIRSIS